MRTVELYGKPRCPLCEEAHAVLASAAARLGFELSAIDVTSVPELFERHRFDVPVVSLDGEVVCRHVVDLAELERRLSARNGE
jgi:glutaredoxin